MSKQPLIDQLDQAITEILQGRAVQPSSIEPSLIDLSHMAQDLTGLPRPGFKARLRSELERNMTMSTAKVSQFRAGFRTVTPYLLPPSPDFIDFAKRAFGAEEVVRHEAEGRFHAEMRIGDSMLMVGVGAARTMPVELIVNVPNSDEVYQRALDAGAVSLEPMTEGHGIRFGCVEDPARNQWCISTHLDGSYLPPNQHSITPCFRAVGAAKFIEFIKSAFGASVVERYDGPQDRVLWSLIQIGQSTVAVSDPGNHSWARPSTNMIYLYVPDVDAVYEQAMRVGAQSIYPPADQPYGDRNGGVTDAWGNQWFIGTPL
jgi:uncharacterized glyoxalase superfamily protein PhnB